MPPTGRRTAVYMPLGQSGGTSSSSDASHAASARPVVRSRCGPLPGRAGSPRSIRRSRPPRPRTSRGDTTRYRTRLRSRRGPTVDHRVGRTPGSGSPGWSPGDHRSTRHRSRPAHSPARSHCHVQPTMRRRQWGPATGANEGRPTVVRTRPGGGGEPQAAMPSAPIPATSPTLPDMMRNSRRSKCSLPAALGPGRRWVGDTVGDSFGDATPAGEFQPYPGICPLVQEKVPINV